MRPVSSGPGMRSKTLFIVGLVLGALMGLAFLLAGLLTLIPGLVIALWLGVKRPRFTGASGGLIGLGTTLLVVLGQATWRCAHDPTCGQADITPWFGLAALLLAIGIALGLVTSRHLRSGTGQAG